MAASEGLIHKYVFFVMLMHSVIFGLLFYALLKLLGKSHKKALDKTVFYVMTVLAIVTVFCYL